MSKHSGAVKKVPIKLFGVIVLYFKCTDVVHFNGLGYLFLLSTGIFFGFKKPLIFFAFENIESISYTSVLQRTFNLNIATRASASEEIQEFELSMIDQADYAGIDGYIKAHGLQDASLAEARRAKRYNVNGGKTEKGSEVNEAGSMEIEGESELQKAQRELEDQEDEEEEEDDEEDNFAGQVNGTKSAMNGYSKGFGAVFQGWLFHALGNQMEGKETNQLDLTSQGIRKRLPQDSSPLLAHSKRCIPFVARLIA